MMGILQRYIQNFKIYSLISSISEKKNQGPRKNKHLLSEATPLQ